VETLIVAAAGFAVLAFVEMLFIGYLFGSVRSLKKQAFLSPVSGLPNLRGIEARLRGMFARLRRRKVQQVTVVAIDLDTFKPINDQYGHKAGDKVLRVAGDILAHSVRPDDIIGHLSGDEFVIVFGDITPERVNEIIECANEKLASHQFNFVSGGVNTRFTYGIATSMREDDTFDGLHHRADLDCNKKKKAEGGSRHKR